LKYNISEKISERNAEINNNLSVVENFLNIMLLIFLIINHRNEQCKYIIKRTCNFIECINYFV
jgi:hypothetical protein